MTLLLLVGSVFIYVLFRLMRLCEAAWRKYISQRWGFKKQLSYFLIKDIHPNPQMIDSLTRASNNISITSQHPATEKLTFKMNPSNNSLCVVKKPLSNEASSSFHSFISTSKDKIRFMPLIFNKFVLVKLCPNYITPRLSEKKTKTVGKNLKNRGEDEEKSKVQSPPHPLTWYLSPLDNYFCLRVNLYEALC